MTIPEQVALKLEGKLLKYTVLVLLVDGRHVEVQTNEKPAVSFKDTPRDVFLCFGYDDYQMFKLSCVAGWTLTENTATT